MIFLENELEKNLSNMELDDRHWVSYWNDDIQKDWFLQSIKVFSKN